MVLGKISWRLLILLIPSRVYSQCEVQDSLRSGFSTASLTVKSFPGSTFLPRTNLGTVSTLFYAEGRSFNPSVAASSSTVFSGAPVKSNVFFGGDDGSNGHANTQIICTKSYNLFSGSVKIRGTFYNRSSNPNYNESYIGIVPVNYNYYAPLDADPGMSGSGLNAREGIIIGAVNGSGNAFLINHGVSTQSSNFIKGPVSSGVDFSKWYTMEAEFEVVNNKLYLKSATYNDGTVRTPLGSNVLIGDVSSFSWLDSLTLIAGVDDMLAEVSIIKYKCNGCVTQDSVVFDMIPKFVTPTVYTGNSTQAATDFSKITSPFAIEAITSNDSFFLNSKNCNNSAAYRRTIYFGGDAPSPEGFSASSIVTKMTYNLFEGPLTLTAAFNNRSNTAEYNESWFSILPADYKHYLSPVMTPSANREGVRVGAWPTQSLVVDSRSVTLDDRIVEPFKIHNYAGWSQWYEAKVVWDTANGEFRCAEFSINTGTGWKKVWNNPIVIGPVSNYPWLSKVRLSILADDMIDSIGIRKTICSKVVKKSCEVSKFNRSFCRNNIKISLDTLFKVSNSYPKNHTIKILAFNNDRSHPNLTTYKLELNNLMGLDWPGGSWLIKIITECGAEDSLLVTLINEPILKLFAKNDVFICSDNSFSPKDVFIDSVSAINGTWNWSGDFINSNDFDIVWNANKSVMDNLSVQGIYKTPNGCVDTVNVKFSIRNKPELTITAVDKVICINDSAIINANIRPDGNLDWYKSNSSDGLVNKINTKSVFYIPGINDKTTGVASVICRSQTIASDPCPVDVDSVTILIIQPPVPAISDSVRLCAPASGTLQGLELSGKNAADLSFTWQISPGTQQSGNNLNFNYPLQGKTDVRLTVTDTSGPCSASISKPAWIQVYPKPQAAFEPDPVDYSMIPGAEFRFRNLSSLDQTLYTGSIISWQWSLLGLRHQDYSNLREPVFSVPDDTATFLAGLIAESDKGCRDTAIGKVYAISKFEVYMPTSFSPDGEGNARNNYYMISAFNYRSFKLKIYSRWGEKLFETTDINKGWDGNYMGSECQEGVYVAVAEVKDMAGYTHLHKQSFHLLR